MKYANVCQVSQQYNIINEFLYSPLRGSLLNIAKCILEWLKTGCMMFENDILVSNLYDVFLIQSTPHMEQVHPSCYISNLDTTL